MTSQPTPPPPPPPPAAATALPTVMTAIVQDKYGRPDEVLRQEMVAVPVPHGEEVVVRVHAASIHVGDLVTIEGEPVIARLALGLRKPKNRVPGTDFAGTVVAVGDGVSSIRPGDEVFGWSVNAFAEYVCASLERLVPKPAKLSFVQASAVGVSASAALQLLRDRVRPGQKVLINGASGGLGSFAVQIAKAFGAEVTAVCSTGNIDAMHSLGASHVIDYTKQDFTLGSARYDFILDNVANHSLSRTRRALTAHGTLQSNNGTSGGRWFGTMGTVITTAVVSRFTRRQAGPSIKFTKREDLLTLKELIDAGQLLPLIDRTYALSQAARAVRHVGGGHARGTVVLTV
ncbi:MAG: alcohol dehydrogenase zinc-binding protein [Cryobacterium sp.]|jgi:NADPH:quinone reductase-like Zn-dependent oxidoreductase|nr:alcohol dehydrogenase zinc-binding protein [Cryobacterium sp.]